VTDSDRGYLTLSTGPRYYLELAVDMALSLKEHTAYPVALVADEAAARKARQEYGEVFDQIVLLPKRFRSNQAWKYGTAVATPFQETMFLDADAFVLATLDGLFEVLRNEFFAMVGDRLGPEEDQNHHGFSTRALIRAFRLDSYLKTNSGLFAFRKREARPFMEECLETFRNELRPRFRWHRPRGAWLCDEIGFGVMGGRRRDVATFPVPGPMSWPSEFVDLDLERPTRPFLHLLGPLPDPILRTLIEEAQVRRVRAGLPESTCAHLHREMASHDRKLLRVARALRLS
jgi:hypothetical protein